MLKVDFYESGKGETVVVEFPDGGLGIVDAHPSNTGSRPTIADITKGRTVHFICLTHPHADHGLDLVHVFSSAASVTGFWHTVSDIQTLAFAASQQPVYPNKSFELIEEMRLEWANFLLDLYDEVETRSDADSDFKKQIHDERKSITIAGVTIHFLSPSEKIQNQFTSATRARVEGKHRNKPNENLLSAILALEYAGQLVVLSGDALAENWLAAEQRIRTAKLPKAAVLKIPHHGASNSLGNPKGRTYLDIVKPDKSTFGVLFAGDSKHPNPSVFDRLKSRLTLQCLANGLSGRHVSNPLSIRIGGARAIAGSPQCNPHIAFSIHSDGRVEQTAGVQCAFCTCAP